MSVHVFLYTPDRQYLAEGYKRYWFDDTAHVLEAISMDKVTLEDDYEIDQRVI